MHLFNRDISFEPNEPFSYSGQISQNWSVNGVPDGGYLMAILAKAMTRHSDMRSTPIVTANFLGRCKPGKAEIAVERIAASRQFDRFQACLVQDGSEKIRAFGTFARQNRECDLESYATPQFEVADPKACIAMPAMPNYTLFEQLDVRLAPDSAGWLSGDLVDRSEIKGWLRFKDERPFDIFSILLFADSFPPAVFSSQGMVAWVPTLEYSVNVRNIPVTKWLQCIFRTRFITCGLLEEDGEIWDQAGNLIAISRQIAQYRTNVK
jgi:acyl-CoA thioesterase